MGRRCACDWLIQMMRTDPHLKVIPAAARFLWMSLADQLLNLPEPGVFKLGLRVGSVKEIALMVSMPEPEVETQLENLLETGLLTRRTDGVLCLPALPEPARRGASSRENGGLGGRPRRGETAEQAQERRRRQRELPLMGVHDGGFAKTQETYPETPADNLPRARAAAASFASEEGSKQAAAGFGELGSELADLAGLDQARGTYNFGPVKEWLMAGANPDLLREVIGRIASRGSYRPPATLSYFTNAVREEMRVRAPANTVSAPVDPVRAAEIREYNNRFERYVENGCLGAPPAAPACLRAVA